MTETIQEHGLKELILSDCIAEVAIIAVEEATVIEFR